MHFLAVFSVCGGLCCILVAALLLYMKFRWRFPVSVTCWFCNHTTAVPYGNKNCWDCPRCEQYNGFTKDGDYNKDIPAQYDSSMNIKTGCQQSEFLTFNKQLCDRCNSNQHLKARLLADFQPINEANFDKEIELHARRLDSWYDICMDCQMTVQQELQKQDSLLSQKLMSYNHQVLSYQPKDETKTQKTRVNLRKHLIYEVISLSCLLFMVIRWVVLLLDTYIVDVNGIMLPWIPSNMQLPWILLSKDVNNAIQIVAFLSTFVSKCILLQKYRLHLIDLCSVILWIVTLLLQFIFSDWTNLLIDIYIGVANLVFTCYSFRVTRRCIPPGIRINRFTFRKSSHKATPPNTDCEISDKPCLPNPDVSGSLDDTLTGLEAFSLGTIHRKQRSSGIFSSSFTSPEKTSPFPKQLSASRPLISPAKLNIMKFNKQNTESPKYSPANSPSISSQIKSAIPSGTPPGKMSQSHDTRLDKMSWYHDTVTSKQCDDNDTDSVSGSSTCQVDSTTNDVRDNKGHWRLQIGIKSLLHLLFGVVFLASVALNTYYAFYKQ